jgi:hypothetical protein
MVMRGFYFVSLLCLGCGKDGGTSNGAVDAPGPPIDGVPPSQVRFQRDVVPIFERGCGTGNDGCHKRNAYGASQQFDCRGWLTLENASLGAQFYAGANAGQPTGCEDRSLHFRLTQIEAWQCGAPASAAGPNVAYVKAGDLDGSYLMRKLKNQNLCDEAGTPTKQMPPSDSVFTISSGDISTIEAWIMAGAKDD